MRRRTLLVRRRRESGLRRSEAFYGLNLGFTRHGLTRLPGAGRPAVDPAFERGADDRSTIDLLHDPPLSDWLEGFVVGRIDGVFLVTGPNRRLVQFHAAELGRQFGASIKVVYSRSAIRGRARSAGSSISVIATASHSRGYAD